ncbi:sucrase ferredoxin [Paenibacillus sp. TAB 01]|uniref:sucrase ferredoxin n=1 Tax=Paenibacillus sp. TAB 01 TaxID=3368988 RepID=UPI003753B381
MKPVTGSTADSLEEAAVRRQYCAQVSAGHREDPIGSAPGHRVYLLVEVPLPWQDQVEQSAHFPAGLNEVLREAAKHSKFRFLGFCSETNASPVGWRRVIRYSKAGQPLTLFDKKEYVVPEGELNALVQALLMDSELSSFDRYTEKPGQVRDLLVCTHGSHDACCGKFGYPLYKEIEQRYAGTEEMQLRVWRTSHFGGHRHAPTLIDFPEGRYWAQLKPELLDTLIKREGSVERISRNYRGWGGINAFAQVAERAAFVQEGWKWNHYEKKCTVVNQDERSAYVTLEYRTPDGSEQGSYEAHVSVSQTVIPIGGCGQAGSEAKQYELVS